MAPALRPLPPLPAPATALLTRAWPLLPVLAGLLLGLARRGRMGAELRRSRRVLHQTGRQLDAILRSAPVGIAQTDLRGRYVMANARYCGILGRDEAALRALDMLALTHPEDRARQHDAQARMIQTGEPFALEKRYQRPDGSEVWVVTHMSVLPDPAGRPTHMLAAVQDMTHRRAADAALRQLAATVEQRVAEAVAERAAAAEERREAQRLEALGQLAGGVAHDFNNVLQAIAGGARLIQRRPGDAAAVERLAALVVDAAERGAGVTQRLLSFARLGSLLPAPVPVAPLLHEVERTARHQPGPTQAGHDKSGPIGIHVDAPDGLPPVLADRAQLEAVLLTLVANARDAMADGGGITLRARADPPGAGLSVPSVRIEVEDSGPGMDPDTLQHATEPFFSTKPRGRGTGLGLAMARGFAEQSGGKLQLRSEPGAGTTATLQLPQAAPPREAGPTRVLLVDDDPDVRDVLAEMLESGGCEVAQAGDAQSALARLDGAPVDLVITDLSMPGTDGLALIRAVQDRWPSLPCILLTGHDGRDLQAALGGMARVRLLGKPVRGAMLMEHVEAMAQKA